MALVSCPECKKEVSNQAESCPNCGYDLTVKGKWYDKTGFVILWIFLFWPVGLYGLFKNKKANKAVKIIVGSMVGIFGLLIIIGIFSSEAENQIASQENNIVEQTEPEYELIGRWLWKNFDNAEIEIILRDSKHYMRTSFSDGSSGEDLLTNEGNKFTNPENQMGEYFVIQDGFLEMWNEDGKFATLGIITKMARLKKHQKKGEKNRLNQGLVLGMVHIKV